MSSALEATRVWVDTVVVGLGLCPFAAEVLTAGRVRFAESAARSPEELLGDLDRELAHLLRTPVARCDTTLLVHPAALRDFADYNDFLDLADALLRERGCEGVVQIASFHPDYVFAEAPPDDPANWTNRSPHPMLHLLREQSVADAIAGYPDVAAVPVRNAARLRELGLEAVRERLARCGH